uniref:Putative secreted protein n=1 Tax=Anopheles darlingi TaxID=43151 RepID=A0A2M4DAG2_ANODA
MIPRLLMFPLLLVSMLPSQSFYDNFLDLLKPSLSHPYYNPIDADASSMQQQNHFLGFSAFINHPSLIYYCTNTRTQ